MINDPQAENGNITCLRSRHMFPSPDSGDLRIPTFRGSHRRQIRSNHYLYCYCCWCCYYCSIRSGSLCAVCAVGYDQFYQHDFCRNCCWLADWLVLPQQQQQQDRLICSRFAAAVLIVCRCSPVKSTKEVHIFPSRGTPAQRLPSGPRVKKCPRDVVVAAVALIEAAHFPAARSTHCG